jgi:hypothetical protein
VTVIGVPYHLDEYLPDLDLTPEPAELITPELPADEVWSRLAVLYADVARHGLAGAQLPALRYPTPGGPDAGQVADALSLLFSTGRVAAVGIACSWLPGRGAARLITPYLEIALANA